MPASPAVPKWAEQIRSFQQKILWYILPGLGLLALTTWILVIRRENAFFITPRLEASAVRRILLNDGFIEVLQPAQANIIWTDAHSASLLPDPRPLQIQNVLTTHADARVDGTCRALTAARERIGNSALAAGVSVAECYVLPLQTAGARAAMLSAGSGAAMWEVEPVDRVAKDLSLAELGKPIPMPPITNNPEDLPAEGMWVARRYDTRAYLIDKHRFTVELYALISSVEPLRVYVHTEGAIWRAGKHYTIEQLSPGDREKHCTSPGEGCTFRCPGLLAGQTAAGRLLPLQVLWKQLQDAEESRALWQRLELAAAVGAMSLLPPSMGHRGSTRRSLGLSAKFELVSVRLHVADDMNVSLHSATAHPPLAEGGAPMHHAVQEPHGWHADMLSRVVSDTLNLTGASMHKQRRWAFSQLLGQLKQVLKARGATSKRRRFNQRRASGRERMYAKGGRGGKGGKASGRMSSRDHARDEDLGVECEHSMMFRAASLAARGGGVGGAGGGEQAEESAQLEEKCLEKVPPRHFSNSQ